MIENLQKIIDGKPLIHHITNWVTIYDCANVVRATGGLPVMAHAPEEVEQMTSISGALVLNIGTLTVSLVKSMILAGKKANEKNIPVVLDVVGAGATDLRTDKANEILNKVSVSILKGNSSEIGTIAGVKAETRGVEAISVTGDPIEIAKKLALEKNLTVVITGKEDIISNGKDVYICKNGHPMMGCFVGSGCMASSVIGTFAAVEKDYAIASANALSLFGIAGELAAKTAKGPASYKTNLVDEIFNINESKIRKMTRLEKIV
ncbi:MAG: hydroxyethylthiazole kinase [Actinomycetota bacterium]|nr:hydroxyethylthiazole kinase [Actinomycetota bacterium]